MNKVIQYSTRFLKRNSSTILTCVGAAGVVTTTVLAVKATPKALTLLEEAKEEKGKELTKLEVVKVAGPAYIPAVVTGVSTIACIFSANMLNQRKQTAITGAYALLDQTYKEYRDKVKELYADEVDTHIQTEIAKDKYKETDIEVDDGTELFYDVFSKRYFNAKMEDVVKAEYEINKKISNWGGAFVNEFYELLDIPPIDGGDELGWSAGQLMEYIWAQWLDFDHDKVVMDDGLECYIITMNVEPMLDYEYY